MIDFLRNMHKGRPRLIFELSESEKENKLKRALTRAVKEAAALDLPLVYRNELCTKPNLFIHKYPNGREVLIEQNVQNSSERTIKTLR